MLIEMSSDPLLSNYLQEMALGGANKIGQAAIEYEETSCSADYYSLLSIARLKKPKDIARAAKEAAERVILKRYVSPVQELRDSDKSGDADNDMDDNETFDYEHFITEEIVELAELRTDKSISKKTREQITLSIKRFVEEIISNLRQEAEEGECSHLWVLRHIQTNRTLPKDVRDLAGEALESITPRAIKVIIELGLGSYNCIALRDITGNVTNASTDYGHGGLTVATVMPSHLCEMARAAEIPTTLRYIEKLKVRMNELGNRTNWNMTDLHYDIDPLDELTTIILNGKNPIEVRRAAKDALESVTIAGAELIRLQATRVNRIEGDGIMIINRTFTERPVPVKPERSGKPRRVGRG